MKVTNAWKEVFRRNQKATWAKTTVIVALLLSFSVGICLGWWLGRCNLGWKTELHMIFILFIYLFIYSKNSREHCWVLWCWWCHLNGLIMLHDFILRYLWMALRFSFINYCKELILCCWNVWFLYLTPDGF